MVLHMRPFLSIQKTPLLTPIITQLHPFGNLVGRIVEMFTSAGKGTWQLVVRFVPAFIAGMFVGGLFGIIWTETGKSSSE